MKIATINIPDDFLTGLESLVNLGLYPSRSEAVREALKQFLKREPSIATQLHNFEAIKKQQMEELY